MHFEERVSNHILQQIIVSEEGSADLNENTFVKCSLVLFCGNKQGSEILSVIKQVGDSIKLLSPPGVQLANGEVSMFTLCLYVPAS